MSYFRFPRYVSVSEKRAQAEKKIRQLMKKDPDLAPVIIEGNTLARTWWGKAWNSNLERYADYHNRIGRGRSYVRHRAVLDLKIDAGKVTARVQGSQSTPYTVEVGIGALAPSTWGTITTACADQLDSLQDLLAGRFPERLAHLFMQKGSGLFPAPEEIQFACSCPDWASMCKHVAAVLYGIGARLDQDPSLFFRLRQVNMEDLATKAIEDTTAQWIQKAEAQMDQPTIAEADLGNLFGIDMDAMDGFNAPAADPPPSRLPAPDGHTPNGKARKSTVSAKQRRASVLGVICSAAGGIRVAVLAKTTALSPAVVRPIVNRLLAEGTIRKISHGVYGPPTRPAKRPTVPLIEAILAIIRNHAKGIGITDLSRESGCEAKQVRNVLFRLVKAGKIQRVERGVYAAIPSKRRKSN